MDGSLNQASLKEEALFFVKNVVEVAFAEEEENVRRAATFAMLWLNW